MIGFVALNQSVFYPLDHVRLGQINLNKFTCKFNSQSGADVVNKLLNTIATVPTVKKSNLFGCSKSRDSFNQSECFIISL